MTTVAYTSPFVPPEWIAAHGHSPQRVILEGTGAVTEGICQFTAGFVRWSAAHPDDAIVITTTCDQMRRSAELIDPARTFLMNVPATWQTPAAVQLYRQELQRLGRFLANLGGTPPTSEHLAKTMRDYQAQRSVSSTPRTTSPGMRLALIGGPMRQTDRWIFDDLEKFGAHVVLDATETGQRTRPAPFDPARLAQDPLDELVRAYFLTIPDAFRRPDTLLRDYLKTQVQQQRVQGVILVRFVWCDLWHAQLPVLRETLNLPVIEIDLGENSDRQRTLTRIESLVGILG